MKRGYYGLLLYRPKKSTNWGTIVRTAKLLDCSFIATVGCRYPIQASDTLKAHRHMPVLEFDTFEEFIKVRPLGASLVAVELVPDAKDLKDFAHPEQAVYVLGSEDLGLPDTVLEKCDHVIKLAGDRSMNVSVAGSIVLYHRQAL